MQLLFTLTIIIVVLYPIVTFADVKVFKLSNKKKPMGDVVRANPWKFYAIRNLVEMGIFVGGMFVGAIIMGFR